jgi:hypothetical protein
MSQVIIPVRSFSLNQTQIRYLYHTSRFLVGGSPLPVGVLLGTLYVTIARGGTPAPFTIWAEKVWTSRMGINGILIPTPTAIANIYGMAPTNAVDVAIALSARSVLAQMGITFSETTNLGQAPTVF